MSYTDAELQKYFWLYAGKSVHEVSNEVQVRRRNCEQLYAQYEGFLDKYATFVNPLPHHDDRKRELEEKLREEDKAIKAGEHLLGIAEELNLGSTDSATATMQPGATNQSERDLKKTKNGIVAWMRRHPVVSTAAGITLTLTAIGLTRDKNDEIGPIDSDPHRPGAENPGRSADSTGRSDVGGGDPEPELTDDTTTTTEPSVTMEWYCDPATGGLTYDEQPASVGSYPPGWSSSGDTVCPPVGTKEIAGGAVHKVVPPPPGR